MTHWPPRFCAACGGRLASFRDAGRARWRCRRCGWVAYGNPVLAVVGVITRRGRLLLTRRARAPFAGTWDLPGGFVEADEEPARAVARELREELGVGTRRAQLLTLLADRYGRGGFPVVTAVYRVTPSPGAMTPADDVAEARWFTPEAIPYRDIAFPSMRRALRAFARRGWRFTGR